MVGNGTRADKGDVCDAGVGSEVVCSLGPACEALYTISKCQPGMEKYACLDEVRVMTASLKSCPDDSDIELGAPGCLLAALYDDAVSCEYRADYRTNKVVKLSAVSKASSYERIPAHTG